ncbi:hypothetical protein HPB48_026216 [Haemaphysalis longicornis]|uniref:Uncharacterized protein n=1 Tax=Haemaphysalis longicornis TaxID=44386 RepID=A0A9J6H0L3_HAELO|nr:hypothetical protein HPB48_026216 [Haemaphysalis longicornis]
MQRYRAAIEEIVQTIDGTRETRPLRFPRHNFDPLCSEPATKVHRQLVAAVTGHGIHFNRAQPSEKRASGVSRPRQPENNLQLFQRRLTHENGCRNQENSRELRCLALEEKRPDFEWASLEQRKAEWKAACEERKEERRLRMEEAAELQRERKQEQEERAEERRSLLVQQEDLLQQRAEKHRMFMAQQEALLNVIRALAIKKLLTLANPFFTSELSKLVPPSYYWPSPSSRPAFRYPLCYPVGPLIAPSSHYTASLS